MTQSEIDTLIFLISDQWLHDDDDAEYTHSWQEFARHCRTLHSPIALHCLAANLNWDYGLNGLRTVLDQHLCDRGTALMIYWLGEPGHMAIMDAPTAAMLNDLQQRYLSDAFTSKMIAVDPRDILGMNELEAGDTSAIPQRMQAPTEGIDATPHIHAMRILATIDRVRRGQLTPANLAATLDHSMTIQRFDPQIAAGIRSLTQKLRLAGRLPSAVNPLLDELKSNLISIVQ